MFIFNIGVKEILEGMIKTFNSRIFQIRNKHFQEKSVQRDHNSVVTEKEDSQFVEPLREVQGRFIAPFFCWLS